MSEQIQSTEAVKPSRKCPYCKKEVEAEATVCPHCRRSFFSSHPLKNAIIGIIAFIVLFILISLFIDWDTDNTMKKIDREADRMMQEMESQTF